jgi:enoyl-CoA hydratase/carnithine racemase
LITFDRSEKLNILLLEGLSELHDAIVDLASGVQAIVFTGAGQAAFRPA